MKSIGVMTAAVLAAAACSHAQPPPPAATAEPIGEASPVPEPAAPAPAAEPPAAPAVEILAASVFFAFDSSELSPDTQATLQTFFDVARQRPDQDFRVEGNCDERGSREYNLALGQRRADAAKKYLVNLGLDASRITTISYGNERPRAPGHDEASWSVNRRDDLVPAAAAISQASR